MKKKLKIGFRILRLAILLAIFAGTFILYRWSKAADPRFYRFVETRPGQTLSKAFKWDHSPLANLPEEKAPDEMTEREKKIQRVLEEELAKEEPTHKLLMKNNKHMTGTLLEVNPDYVLFSETYGDSGSLSVKVQRSRIEEIVELDPNMDPVTYQDVRFKLEFPMMNFYKRPPYTILTDESFFSVERSVRVLQKLHTGFVGIFGPLITQPRKGENIQLAFFSQEKSFRRYQRKYAPHMDGCLGFYSPALDRFLVYNEKGSEQLEELAMSLEEMEAEYRADAKTDSQRARVNRWKRDSHRRMMHMAEQRTFTTLRHEGAHQLFFTYGVHSSFRIENEWLVEGLATYCESENIGNIATPRVKKIKTSFSNKTYIPLSKLMDLRPPSGFMSLGSNRKIDLAYSESWSLIHYLMSDPVRQEAFFNYIRYTRDNTHVDEVVKTPRLAMLARFLQTTSSELEASWKRYVKGL